MQVPKLMRPWLLPLLVFAASCSLTVIRSSRLDYAEETGFALSTPAANESVVVFLRPSFRENHTSAIVYDGEEFVSIVMAHSHFVYRTTPGNHRFSVISESADFMDADLAGGKIYFANLEPREGWGRARFNLSPVAKGTSEFEDLASWIGDSYEVTPNASAVAWAEANFSSVKEKQSAQIDDWLQKEDQPRLRSEDGISQFPR